MGEQRNLTLEQALDLGAEMHRTGQYDSAAGLLRGVLMHDPKNFEAILRLGSTLFEQKKYHEALYWFWRGRKIDRRHPMALTNYGLCLSQLGHPDEGVVELERAIFQVEKAGNMADDVKSLVYNNLGNTLERIGRYPEALRALEKGIGFNPKHGFAYYNRGIVLMRLNRHLDAIYSFNEALTLNPEDHDAHYNRGIARLTLGDLKNGFADYESRLVTTENETPNFGLPAEKQLTRARTIAGHPIRGKVILVHGEQGLGDDIQFFRYLPLLAKRRPAEIKVVCHTATKPFLDGLPVTQLQTGEPLGEYDHWVALMSLPHIMAEDIPPPQHGLVIERERDLKWMELAHCVDRRLNVGVCWAGNWRHKNDAHRSIPLQTFKTVFDIPHCNFVSLQQLRPGEVDAFHELQVHSDNITAFELTDFRDTAAIMRHVDVVLTVDTAIAHLAGTLGVPTKILIPAFSTDWRWQRDRIDSPWYPTARLYRQPRIGDWDTALDRAIADIGALAKARVV